MVPDWPSGDSVPSDKPVLQLVAWTMNSSTSFRICYRVVARRGSVTHGLHGRQLLIKQGHRLIVQQAEAYHVGLIELSVPHAPDAVSTEYR